MIRKIKTLWELTRLEHGLMYGFGVIIGMIIAGGEIYAIILTPIFGLPLVLVLPTQIAALGFFTALFIQAGTFALNDYCDLESDIANQRLDRPLVRGELRKEEALLVAVIATAFGIISAAFLSYFILSLVLLATVLGILYDIKLKEFFIVSNVYIALTMALPFIFGSLIVEPGRVDPVILTLTLIAFLAGFGREVMKDIADVKGDALRDVKSIARVYGIDKAVRTTVFSYLLAVILSVVPFFLVNTVFFLNLAYLLPVMVANAFFLHTSIRLLKTRIRIRTGSGEVHAMRKETLLAIGIGLIAFVCGALFQIPSPFPLPFNCWLV